MPILFFDGGSRNNPGPSGCGAVLYDQNDRVLWESWLYLDHATNNEAEYRALIMGLEVMANAQSEEKDHEAKEALEIRGDSQLIIHQVQGTYQTRNPRLRPLRDRVLELLDHLGLDAACLAHVLRSANKHADLLANRAMDLGESGFICTASSW